MGVINDLLKDLRDYPDNSVNISIVNFTKPGGVFEKNEVCTFKVRIKNNGYLDMMNVSLHIHNKPGYTLVSQSDFLGNPFGFSSRLTTATIPYMPAGNIQYTRTIYCQAIEKTEKPEVLFRVHLNEWDAGLNSLLRMPGHDVGEEAKYTLQIY